MTDSTEQYTTSDATLTQPPTNPITILRPFSDSPTLTTLFGDEDRFQAAGAAEIAALISSETILKFLKEKSVELAKAAGGKALEWVSAQLFKALGIGGDTKDLDQIKELLDEVLRTQQLILSKLEELLREVQFQHLVTRGFESVERIANVYEKMQRLSRVVDKEERAREAALLTAAILDPNLGATLNLKSISDVMLGQDPLGRGDPLINLFVDRWFPIYTAQQLADDVPLSTYRDKIEAWLHGVFVILFMGLAELANARIANGDFELLKAEIDFVTQQMEEQKKLVARSIPAWSYTLYSTMTDGRWYIVRGLDLRGGRIDNSQVLYGSPASGTFLDYSVQFRDRHRDNGDEEWQFHSFGPNDTFYAVERSRPRNLEIDRDRFVVGGNKAKLRIVMAVTRDPKVKPDAPRSERLVPVIGIVGRNQYMKWRREGQNLALIGSIDEAVRVAVEYSGH